MRKRRPLQMTAVLWLRAPQRVNFPKRRRCKRHYEKNSAELFMRPDICRLVNAETERMATHARAQIEFSVHTTA